MQQPNTLAEIVFVEAVARRARVQLVLRPVTPSSASRLSSRFLALQDDCLVLATPEQQAPGDPHTAPPHDPPAARRKVFVPVGWDLGICFPLGGFLVQARSRVAGHGQVALDHLRRVDALLIDKPSRILSLNRRLQVRQQPQGDRPIQAAVWAYDDLLGGPLPPPLRGQVADSSPDGLGIELPHPLPSPVGTAMIVRLQDASQDLCRILRATIRHCTQIAPGRFVAGFSHLVELEPGQALVVMNSLAQSL